MKALLKGVGFVVLSAFVFATGFFLWARSPGFSARAQPTALEQAVARRVRLLAMPETARERSNSIAATPVAIREGLRHYADHCAVCHANDGSGNTDMGKGLYPRPPDMRLPATQELTDGEIFYIIENGIRFTGMPAWAPGTPEGEAESWKLVHFIRHLPELRPEELEDMEELNPISMEQLRQQLEQERLLESEPPQPAPAPARLHEHGERSR